MAENMQQFSIGDVITQVSRDGLLVDYYVEEVISPTRVKVYVYDGNGELTQRWRYLGYEELLRCRLNAVATRLLRAQRRTDPARVQDVAHRGPRPRRFSKASILEAFERHAR
ncbi:hypothetical protein J2T57_001285 [Natronocella acetinitrilica]|uniref:Uncharacterized protein n=1 Tax=Natronocella acetinitrilica TaxID=414046 RepID=A0AAE3G2X4_9GAMM|nr:hypothetical protein [Natronocella acetinitrilica]MCP1674183.1 hypothetical protein [Natronocella acetinitrilica]